mgnify:CR=1 FL=1
MFSLLIYRVLILLLLPLLLLALLLRSLSNPQYRQRINERLGFFPKPCVGGGIVVHAASVGEVIALTPFVEQLLANYPHQAITITTFTPTGSEQVKKTFGNRVQHGFLPLDVFPCTQLFLSRLQPKLVIFMETELWPNLIAQCANKKIKLLLINGRLSQNSMKSYQKIKALMAPSLNRFNKILCQSHDNYDNFIKLGAKSNYCQISGNLKFDLSVNQTTADKVIQLQKLLPDDRTIWLVASTHEGDEALALNAFKEIKTMFPQLLLVLVPRHPERFKQVASLCLSHHFTLAKRSEEIPVIGQDIWVLDTLGELMAAYSLADIVTMGGSFNHVGGHNPLEPALYKKAIIVGHNMSNFTEIMQQMQQNSAIMQLSTPASGNDNEQSQALASAVITLLKNQQQVDLLGERAQQVVMANQGASTRTLAEVKALIDG